MNIVKRIAATIALTAFVICMAGTIKAKADAPNVLVEIIAADLTSIQYAYDNLTDEKKLIVEYMVGAYNNIYLCARGFSYNINSTESNIKAEFLAIGNRILTFAFTRNGWRSRVNEVFRQYLSSVIAYTNSFSNTITFNQWYDGIRYGGNNQLYIPYSQEAFDAWTTFYNDPSGDGIRYFGIYESNWSSGDYLDFEYTGYSWDGSTYLDRYNNFILNNSPVLYGRAYGDGRLQYVAGDFQNIPNAIFVQRGSSYMSFRYGFYQNNVLRRINGESFNLMIISLGSNNRIGCNLPSYYQFADSIYSLGTSYNNISDFVFACFNYRVPISQVTQAYITSNASYTDYITAYPFIEHVFLVDDLNSLSNPEEVYNTEDLGITAPVNPYYIVAPNDKLILPLWPTADDDPMDLWENIKDNSLKPDGTPATDDDFHNSIVNNTVINNYYVTSGDNINVPVDWFDNEYTVDLFNDSQDVFQFAADCIDSLGDIKIYMYGAIVVGLAGGVVNKLLL